MVQVEGQGTWFEIKLESIDILESCWNLSRAMQFDLPHIHRPFNPRELVFGLKLSASSFLLKVVAFPWNSNSHISGIPAGDELLSVLNKDSLASSSLSRFHNCDVFAVFPGGIHHF